MRDRVRKGETERDRVRDRVRKRERERERERERKRETKKERERESARLGGGAPAQDVVPQRLVLLPQRPPVQCRPLLP